MGVLKNSIKAVLPKLLLTLLKEVKFQIKCFLFKLELKKRSKLSPFDYKELAQDMQLVTKEYGYNAFYGLADIIKKLEGFPLDKPLVGAVEHGVYYANIIDEVDHSQDEIWTLSQTRAHFLREKFPQKKIHAFGPYIQYVKGIYDEQYVKELKKINGKTLLVFHVHSTPHTTVSFSEDKFVQEIKRIKEKYKFETVYVNIYWNDIKSGEEKKYVEAGFKICTAGHMYDPLFLPRLRSIIDLADMTMGSAIGTHIGYCAALGKSHYFFRIDPEYFGQDTISNLSEDEKAYYYRFVDEIERCFSLYHEKLNNDDIDVIKYYWGEF